MTTTQQKKSVNPIIIIGALFFVFGFITWLNSVLIPYLKIACELSNFEAYLVAFSFYLAYFFTAIPASRLLRLYGYKKCMSLGLWVMALGALVFIPAAVTRTYGLFLAGLFIQGTGLTLLQAAANPYITILGPLESAARRISIMGVCNKLAGAIAPIVLGAVVLQDADMLNIGLLKMTPVEKTAALDQLATRVIVPYLCIMVSLTILAVLIYFSGLPEISAEDDSANITAANNERNSVMKFPGLLLGVLAMFLYVGVEVMAGDTVISYGAYHGIPLLTAKFFTTCTLVGMIAGYITGIICIPRYFTQETALKLFALSGVLLTIAAIATNGYVSVACIALLGFANSLIFPAIWPIALKGLGRFTQTGSSLLVMAISGGAVIPLLYGQLADMLNPRTAYWVMVPCYLFILYYGYYGTRTVTADKNTLFRV
ncbi:MAG: glucose/galactose MFS transporter [Sphingobacteriales bacterium]|nr:MAG: glucose/galactose MFS transporter [Sphingobacteriales bacterium]